MFLATALVLTSVAAANPSLPLASTYDQAACADDDDSPGALVLPALVNDGDGSVAEAGDCSEPPPAAPAVIDCNDERSSRFVAEMIGSCDMPRAPAPTGGPPVVRAPGSQASRICNGLQCVHDSTPIRAAARASDDGAAARTASFALTIRFDSSPLAERAEATPLSISSPRLERPPRAR